MEFLCEKKSVLFDLYEQGLHVPLLKQGLEKQADCSVSHWFPEKGGTQLHA